MFTLIMLIVGFFLFKRLFTELYESLLNRFARFLNKLLPKRDIVLGKSRRLPFYGEQEKAKAKKAFISLKNEIQKHTKK